MSNNLLLVQKGSYTASTGPALAVLSNFHKFGSDIIILLDGNTVRTATSF